MCMWLTLVQFLAPHGPRNITGNDTQTLSEMTQNPPSKWYTVYRCVEWKDYSRLSQFCLIDTKKCHKCVSASGVGWEAPSTAKAGLVVLCTWPEAPPHPQALASNWPAGWERSTRWFWGSLSTARKVRSGTSFLMWWDLLGFIFSSFLNVPCSSVNNNTLYITPKVHLTVITVLILSRDFPKLCDERIHNQ